MIRRYLLCAGLILLFAACSDKQEQAPPKTGAAVTAQAAATVTKAAAETVRSGRELFNYWCLPCHGAGPGHAGTQRLARRLGADQSVLLQRHNLSAKYVQHVVRNGFQMMPPFRYTEISDQELQAVAAYVSKHGKE
jgi:mono/diheme cytochrome c family protein